MTAATGPLLGITVLNYVGERRKLGELTGASPATYRRALWSFVRHVGPDLPVSRISRRHVEQWLMSLDVAPATIRLRLVMFTGFSRWCVMRGYLKRDPTLGIKGPKLLDTVPRALDRGDIATALREAEDTRGALMICLGVQLGLRCCEIATVQIGDIDRRLRQLVVRHGKGGRQRVLPIPDEAWTYLTAYLAEHPARSGPLIRSYRHPHRGVTPQYVSILISRTMHAAGIDETAHALRHPMATDVLRAGASVRDVQAALGHANLKTTERYLPLVVDDLRTAMAGRTYRDADRGEP